ncbi:MAG: hypothetical protein CEN89_469 [Candidatus Berkelbacteria bacterium Licking1014_7]|uniref:Uncharacterized protein n=1 Tax=Candidatus Berkelbacteria bacterium Licking1014_7 TaxID=2017147 RepID=A0A554LIU5_9BACT|nr:MAG: hypothetical protein CEN89_469 [Candidatus Berkelbacteria bacterium Licking1014_7]
MLRQKISEVGKMRKKPRFIQRQTPKDFNESFREGVEYIVRAQSYIQGTRENPDPSRQQGIVVTVLSQQEIVYPGFVPHSLIPEHIHNNQEDLHEIVYYGSENQEYIATLLKKDPDKMHLTFSLQREFHSPFTTQ